jgi:hypothetical protein
MTDTTSRLASGTDQVRIAHPMDDDPFGGIPGAYGDETDELLAEPTFPPAEPEPSISLAAFQQRVQAGEWSTPAWTGGRCVHGGEITYRTRTDRRTRVRRTRANRGH